MRDVTILMGSQQGLPAEMLAALAEAGVRVDAGCLFPRVEGRVAHVAVEDDQMDVVRAVAGRHAVTVADDRECLRVPAGYDGGAPEVAQRIAAAGLTVNVAYFGVNGDIILATTDFEAAREALGL